MTADAGMAAVHAALADAAAWARINADGREVAETADACSCPCDCPAPGKRDDDGTPGWCDPCRMNIHQVEGAGQ